MAGLFKSFLEISLIASVMIMAVMGIRAAFAKRMNPAVIAAMWALVLVRLCMPVMLESPVHIGDLIPESIAAEQTAEAETTAMPATDSYTVQHMAQPDVQTEIVRPSSQTDADIQPTTPTFFERLGAWVNSLPLWSVLAAAWGMGALAVLLVTMRCGIVFKRRLKACKRITDGTIYMTVDRYRNELGIRRKVACLVCDDIKTPAVFGYFRPVILLPGTFADGIDEQTANCIILHEMCHIKRHDILKSYVWLVAKALHWFNPLVWVAFKMAKDDMELCCDEMVLSQIGADRRFTYTQSLVDVFRMSKQTAALPVTVSLFENKAKLTERVLRMLKPDKRSRGAAVVSVLLALMMLVMGFTTACSPEKEQAAIAETETAQPEASADAIQPPEEEDIQIEESEAEAEPLSKYSVTDHWTDSFSKEGSVLTIDVDAEIVIPDMKSFSVYDIEPNINLTQATADKMINVFFGDTPVYESTPVSREQLEKRMDILKKEYADMQDGTFDYTRCDTAVNSDEIQNETKRYIYSLEYRIEQAKDVDFVPLNTSLDDGELLGMADLGAPEYASIRIRNEDDRYSSMTFENDGDYSEPLSGVDAKASLPGLTISEDEAVDRAEDLLAALGLMDYEPYSIAVVRRYVCPVFELIFDDAYAYRIVLTRTVDGLVMSQHTAYMEQDENMMVEQARWLTSEMIVITVDDNGIRRFYWQAPYEISEREDATLMPFEQIKNIIAEYPFEKYQMIGSMDKTDEDDPAFRVTDAFIKHVYEIKLEMARMPIGKNMQEQRIVPVWNVYATNEVRGRSKDENGNFVPVVEEHEIPDIMLTINAIDGSMF